MHARTSRIYLFETGPYHVISIKSFLLILEGMFRLLPRNINRNDDEIWNAMVDMVRDAGSESLWYKKSTDAAIFAFGGRKRRAGGEGGAPGGDGDGPALPWNIFTAESISVVGLRMQAALLEGKLITYLVEWCETPSVRQPGVAYDGVSVLYDKDGQIVTLVSPSASNNIYMCIPHSLLDPVAKEAKETLHTFLKQTFWCNTRVWLCMNVAQA